MTSARPAAAAARLIIGLLLPAQALGVACRTVRKPEVAGAPEASAPASTEAAPAFDPKAEDPEIVVKKVQEEIVVAAWAEPKVLPPGGGQAQLLVRVQKRGGAAFPGVEVRFKTSNGSLYSKGKILVTDGMGRTRDRLNAKETTTVNLNAGGTRYSFQVPVSE
jgi:hypothetical protein